MDDESPTRSFATLSIEEEEEEDTFSENEALVEEVSGTNFVRCRLLTRMGRSSKTHGAHQMGLMLPHQLVVRFRRTDYQLCGR